MCGERRLSGSPLLACEHNNVHFGFLAVVIPCFPAKQIARKHASWRFRAFVLARYTLIRSRNTFDKAREKHKPENTNRRKRVFVLSCLQETCPTRGRISATQRMRSAV